MASATKDNQELRKSDYKYLLQKYKTVEEANDFFKLQLQDLNARLKIEHKEKERLYQELKKARLEIVNKPSGHGALLDADIEEVNARLKEAYSKLEEEFELREQLNKDLEYTKNMLLAEGRTRSLLENRNSILEQELRNKTPGKSGTAELQSQLEETKKRLEEEIKSRLALLEAKEKLEAELEDLTKSLFEEANSMVSKEAREKYELQIAKKRLEEELELAKSKIMLDEKLLSSMKHKFTALEMKAKKMHRRTGSSSAAISSSSPGSQLRPTSSHPNLLTLRDDIELKQRSKSFLHLAQAVSLPSSPVSGSSIPSSSPLSSSQAPSALPPVHLPLSPEPHGRHAITPSASPSASPMKPIPINLVGNATSSNPFPSSQPIPTPSQPIPTPSQPIPARSGDPTSNPINPVSTSPISTSPVAHDYTLTTGTTISSDDTYSEGLSQHDTASIAEGDVEEWDGEWLVDEGEEKEDDSVLFAEVEGRIDVQGGLSHFVQFLSAAKQDWAGRFMERVLRDDVGPCLRLRASEDRAYRKLLEAVWNNRIFMEPLAQPIQEMCAGCGAESTCRWRVKIGSNESKHMGDLCRERIVRTCDFYSYLRNLKQGLVKKTLPNIFKEYLRLRLMMNFARICAG